MCKGTYTCQACQYGHCAAVMPTLYTSAVQTLEQSYA
jgi:hypothetical protein